MSLVRSIAFGLWMMASLPSIAQVITIIDSGHVASPQAGAQFWGIVDIAGLRYERTTTIDTGMVGATYIDGPIPFDNSGEWVRELVGGATTMTNHGVGRLGSPALVSYSLTVFTASGAPIFTFAGLGTQTSVVMARHRQTENTSGNLVVQASSPLQQEIFTSEIARSQLQVFGTNFALPPPNGFIAPGTYLTSFAADSEGSSGNAVTASHYVNPQTVVEDLRAILIAQQYVVTISSIPEPSSGAMILLGGCILAAARLHRRVIG